MAAILGMVRVITITALAVILGAASASAQQVAPPAAVAGPGPVIKKQSGVWVEGPGFDITYGGNYDGCAKRCLGTPKCVMIEYYRPEKKCNMYDTLRPRKSGGSSDVGIRG
jgi:hypothetical protein